ncbi:unnamed protein product [Dovyalis caffra]|uniref:Uncharacterized protein n=1 Tax=Dovyalis caffra TaxID=77055 RepID=A0AAV1R344_9ROSI|nr:unnamed protein product [Dovyalis caffra]
MERISEVGDRDDDDDEDEKQAPMVCASFLFLCLPSVFFGLEQKKMGSKCSSSISHHGSLWLGSSTVSSFLAQTVFDKEQVLHSAILNYHVVNFLKFLGLPYDLKVRFLMFDLTAQYYITSLAASSTSTSMAAEGLQAGVLSSLTVLGNVRVFQLFIFLLT